MVRILALVAGVVGVASVVVPQLSIPAALALLVTGLLAGTADKRVFVVVVIGAVSAAAGLVRFVVQEAAPGVVEAGQNAQARSAMYKLREIRLAEDGLRKTAAWDPDGDGVGSAGSLGELAALRPMRGQKPLEFPLLPLKWRKQQTVKTAQGDVDVACLEGYCFAVFVPTDDERAERRYTAYAWPAGAVIGKPAEPLTTMAGDPRDVLRGQVLFLDEHERIFESGNPGGYHGLAHIPRFDAALPPPTPGQDPWDAHPRAHEHGHVGVDGATWKPWKGKQAMGVLAGDL